MKKIIINDKDRAIYSFWYSILNNTEEFCSLIETTPITIETWEKQKIIQKNKSDVDLLTLGFSTFFLNRTNRSGILNAGAIGGRHQTGKYKIDARFNKLELISRIRTISDLRDNIDVLNEDAVDLLTAHDWSSHNGKVFIYLDPPYYIKGRNLYLNYYREDDHKEIADILSKSVGFKWVVSYDKVDFIESIYQQFRCAHFQLNYSANNSGKGNEIIFYSNDLIIPKSSII